jgi:RNA polymerase sigma-70 factor (ECF subfamily)
MGKHTDDIFLLRQIKEDNEIAFKFLFEIYFAPICRFIFLYIKNKSIVEEISLDVFTAFWEKRKTIEVKLSLKAYLFQSARNHAVNYIRDNRHIISVTEDNFIEIFEEDNPLEVQELGNLIEEAICALPQKCQEVFRKSREDNLTNKEIALQLNITTKTVEAQITKSLKLIREYLSKSYNYLF